MRRGFPSRIALQPRRAPECTASILIGVPGRAARRMQAASSAQAPRSGAAAAAAAARIIESRDEEPVADRLLEPDATLSQLRARSSRRRKRLKHAGEAWHRGGAGQLLGRHSVRVAQMLGRVAAREQG
jgi:hypothetical protein